MPYKPTNLLSVLEHWSDKTAARVHVARPGVVQSYDPIRQVVDVKPQIQEQHSAGGTFENVPLPVVCSVPVVFPGAAGFRITFPIAAGTTGLLVFLDRSRDAWQSGGGDTSPDDARRHHLTDAVFFPGLHPNNAAWSDADASAITIGSDLGTADFVATANRVLEELTKLKNAFDGHTHAAGTMVAPGGTGGPVTGVTGGAAASPSLTAPASSTVKVKG
jgi:hypothetical protein